MQFVVFIKLILALIGSLPKTVMPNSFKAIMNRQITKGGNYMSTKDLTGMTFDKLTVIKKSDVVNKRTMWLCRCACGKETKVSTNKLTSGHTTSCGCKRKKFNGDSKTELYMHYRAMKNRCHPNYHNHKVYYIRLFYHCKFVKCHAS